MSTSDQRPRRRSDRRRSTIARHGRLRKRGPGGTILTVLASSVAVVLVSAVAVVGYAAWDLSRSVKPSIHLVGEKTAGPVPDVGTYPGGFNLLIAASDTRTGQGGAYGSTEDSSGAGLNDVTMLLHVAQDHSNATLVSFPRDLMIPIPECPDGSGGWHSAMSKQPINTTLNDGGMACTVLTVKELTGLDIPFAGVVNFDGVVAMSNALGGVQVCVANGIDDPDAGNLKLSAGMNTLKGEAAAQFLRTRHGVGDGSDLGRVSNQQVFLSALVRQITSNGTLQNPATVWGLAKAALGNVQFSESLKNLTTLYQVAMLLKDLDLSKVLFLQYPTFTDPDNVNRVVPDYDSATPLFDALKNDQPIQLGGTVGRGAIVSTDAPTAPVTPASPTGSAVPTTGTPAAPAVILPDNIQGQAASTATCSKGNQ